MEKPYSNVRGWDVPNLVMKGILTQQFSFYLNLLIFETSR